MMNILKYLHINTFEFDELWKILLEVVAPTTEVELVLTLLAVVVAVAVVPAGPVTWTTVEAGTANTFIMAYNHYE